MFVVGSVRFAFAASEFNSYYKITYNIIILHPVQTADLRNDVINAVRLELCNLNLLNNIHNVMATNPFYIRRRVAGKFGQM